MMDLNHNGHSHCSADGFIKAETSIGDKMCHRGVDTLRYHDTVSSQWP